MLAAWGGFETSGLWRSIGFGGSADGTLVGELGEDDKTHVGCRCFGGGVELEGDWTFAEVLDLSDPLERPDDADVVEMLAAVFTRFDLGGGGGVDKGSVEVASRKRGATRGGDGAGDAFAVDCRLGRWLADPAWY